jgi:fatty acid desaturase
MTSPFTSASEDDDRSLLEGLLSPNPVLYWVDLLSSAAVGWSAVAIGIALPEWRPPAIAVAIIALYRGLCLMHEISHLRPGSIPGFATAWNLLIGVPLLMPSFIYGTSHLDHHKTATFGTAGDPEYLPFAGARGRILSFLIENALLPLALPIRYLAAAPIGLVVPPAHRFLETHASTLSFNHAYRRTISQAERGSMKRWEAFILVAWAAAIAALAAHGLLGQAALVLGSTFAAIAVINALRTLAAHRYRGDGASMDRDQQLLDSVDIPRGLAEILWAPIGLRYHAMHHYFPGVPYHHLGRLHARVMERLTADGTYHGAICPSLPRSLLTLWKDRHRAPAQADEHQSARLATSESRTIADAV